MIFSVLGLSQYLSGFQAPKRNPQCGQHIARANAVHTDSRMCPFHCQASREMPDSCFCCIVWRLGLRNVDNGSGHGANHDNTSRRFSLHQVPCHTGGEQIRPINVDSPKLLHTIVWICNGIKVLREACRCHQVVNLAVILDDLGNHGVDRVGIRDVSIMCCDLRYGRSGFSISLLLTWTAWV